MLLAAGPLLAGSRRVPMLQIETWRIKAGNLRLAHDYWIDGIVKNTSGQRMSDINLVFAVKSAKGTLLGETKASPKLVTLLPDQECPFAAQVSVHDSRMYKMVLTEVTVGMVGEVVMMKAIPFSTEKTSAFFAGVRHEP